MVAVLEILLTHSCKMPWDWSGTGEKSVSLGGRRGTPEEAAVGKAWPAYETEYLKHRLDYPAGKYLPAAGAEKSVKDYLLLDKAAEDYKEEADECLEAEFREWLAGRHPDNINPQPYINEAGKPVRRHTYRDSLTAGVKIGDPMHPNKYRAWTPTWWKDAQLTHLPEVREYLKSNEQKRSNADVYMNLLAEHGPQDLKSAWMYFKHWVKGRPIGPETCPTDKFVSDEFVGPVPTVPGTFVTDPDTNERLKRVDKPPGQRSDFGPNAPQNFVDGDPQSKLSPQPDPLTAAADAFEIAAGAASRQTLSQFDKRARAYRRSTMLPGSFQTLLEDFISPSNRPGRAAAARARVPDRLPPLDASPPLQAGPSTSTPPPPSSTPPPPKRGDDDWVSDEEGMGRESGDLIDFMTPVPVGSGHSVPSRKSRVYPVANYANPTIASGQSINLMTNSIVTPAARSDGSSRRRQRTPMSTGTVVPRQPPIMETLQRNMAPLVQRAESAGSQLMGVLTRGQRSRINMLPQ